MIYILRLSAPLSPLSTAQYYIGYAKDDETLLRRVTQHQKGNGARFTQVAVERNLAITVVTIIEGNRAVERKLKRQKNTRRIVERARRGTLKEHVLYAH